jgi:5'-deoxynucleotidase YfbR-like HD superfamily hydrolase
MTCRFTGHCSEFYSVAEHSWHVARMLEGCPIEVQIAGLLHDASEAYITDIASPIKQHLSDYVAMEDNILMALFAQYNLEYPPHPAVKQADLAMLSTEAHYLMPSKGNKWDMWKQHRRPAPNALYRPINMPPPQAKQLFLDKFNELYELYRASLRTTTA